MKRIFTLLMVVFALSANAQLLSWSPDFIKETSTGVSFIVNAASGNQGLLNYTGTTDVYVHTGVITNKSTSPGDWQHVVTTWATTYGFEHTVYLGNNKWQFTIDTAGGLRSFYNLTDTSEHILKIAILFRSADGNTVQRNADGSDMYIPVYGNGEYCRIDNPFTQPTYTPLPETINKNIGDALPIVAKASLANSNLQIYFNGKLLSSVTGIKDSISATITASGTQTIIAKATSGTLSASDTFTFFVNQPNNVAPVPSGKAEGINYESGDTSVTIVLYAPLKKNIVVVGDFNNWTQSSNYLMNITPDGNYFWIRLTGLTKGVQYAYQYVIDNTLQLADYNSQLVLDKNADPYIPAGNYPGLKAFPSQAAGTLAGIIQTAQTPYTWHDNSFVKPDKRNLAIYELLVRDFVATQSWNTLADTLSYLKRLGINAIEVMPFCNFEGASSWGYNPNFFFAPDKQYGTPAALKHFIDVCHQNGIAVIMDIAMQDVFGSSPLVSMYYNAAANTPTHTNPWLDSLPTHPFNVGYEFNHSSAATIDLRNRIYAYWIDSFHLDGFRFDLAGGYTQTQYSTDGSDGSWQATYDQGRVNTWDSIYTTLQRIKPNTYCILESFVNNTEQKIYTNNGMLTWGSGGDENYSFNQSTMGYSDGWDFSNGIFSSSGLSEPGEVTYQESHDEERIQFKNEAYGNSSGSYTVKDTATGLKRNGMATAFWAMMPGPKMLWQFGELGYDYTINQCTDGSVSNDCRLSPKPIRWDYYKDTSRKALFNIYARLINLKETPAYVSTFIGGLVAKDLSSSVKWMSVSGAALKVMVYGNFNVTAQSGSITFPSAGNWYNLFTGSIKTVTAVQQSVTLQPGEYYVYVSTAAALPVTWLGFTAKASGTQSLLNWSVSSAIETNGSAYNIERSADALHFTVIGTVPVLKVSGSVNNYMFTDKQPLTGVNFYRIAEADKDGKLNYSSIESVSFAPDGNSAWKVYPDPAPSGSVSVLHSSSSFAKMDMLLSDASGKQLYHYSTTNVVAGSRFNIPVANLAKGVYFLKVSTDKNTSIQRIIVF